MKALGYAVITVGFLVASYYAVRSPEGVPATSFLIGLGVGIFGVILVRLALRREATHEERLASNIETLEASLVSLVEKTEALEREKGELDVYELRHVIDDRFPPDLDAFVQARESIGHSFGLQAYADVMSPFAAGERHLNRVWSASTDGYVDEAHTYIALARQELEHALEVFRKVKEEAGAPGTVGP